VVSAVIGSIGVAGGVVTLTGITLASNLGTFALYAVICGVTFVAFAGQHGFSWFKHALIPFLGLLTNIGMMLAIFILGIVAGGDTASETYLALILGGGWLLISGAYFVISSRAKGKAILPSAATMTQ
jgi:hypothetical protein